MLHLPLLTFLLASGGAPALLPIPVESGPVVHPTRLWIEPAQGVSSVALTALHAELGGRVVLDLARIGWQCVEVAPAELAEARAAYEHSPFVARATFDPARRLAHVPNDPLWPQQWSLAHLHANTAWDTTRGVSSVKVAVIDTGCDVTHPDLAPNVWTNPGEVAGNGLDDDQDGFVDDVRGWDFVNGDGTLEDLFGHGTACSGIVAARQDDALGMSGVAPLCTIVPLKACNDQGQLFDSYVVPALLYAADHGCKVISMSFYGDDVTPAERAAIDYCWAHGALPIGAAGNDAQVLPYYPGAYEHTLAIASHDTSDAKSWFSNWGSWVDVAAPGEGIVAPLPGAAWTTTFAGTSAATPHVAGIAALLCSAQPSATNAEVRAAIEDSATTLSQPMIGTWTGYGRVDARAALDRLLGTTPPSKRARVAFISPVGGGFTRTSGVGGALPHAGPELLVDGIGFELPRVARVLRDGVALPLFAQTRNELAANLGFGGGTKVDVQVGGRTLASLAWERGPGWLYAPSDANGRGTATWSGGFAELAHVDGRRFTCSRDANTGQVFVQLSVRRVRGVPATIEWRRACADAIGAVETVDVYDWSTWSYPYGSFVNVATTTVTSASERSSVIVLPANPARFLDDEGTMYVRITVTNAGTNALLSMDSFRARTQ